MAEDATATVRFLYKKNTITYGPVPADGSIGQAAQTVMRKHGVESAAYPRLIAAGKRVDPLTRLGDLSKAATVMIYPADAEGVAVTPGAPSIVSALQYQCFVLRNYASDATALWGGFLWNFASSMFCTDY
ncbi:hypothetical protein DIPPA_22306 [Diplonema papillatum]|nr:hypothetical protein DIPPA_22306 [Diplonema papillatum]